MLTAPSLEGIREKTTRFMLPALKWECLISKAIAYNYDEEESKSRVCSGQVAALPTILVCASVICADRELTQYFHTL